MNAARGPERAAAEALRAGRFAEARALAQGLVDRQPGHPAALMLLGHALEGLAHHREAATRFRAAMAAAPERPEPAFALCLMLLRLGDGEAQRLLTTLLDRFAAHAPGWERLGTALGDAGQNEAALLCLRRAAAAAPRADLLLRCGLLLRDLGRHRDAMAAFGEACDADPSSTRARFLLGVAAADAGDPAAACRAYREALALDPTLAEAAVNLGTVLQESGDLDGAKGAYAGAVRERPDTFGRVAQALSTAPRGELWLDLAALRRSLAG